MLKKLLWVLVACCWASYSYSDGINPYYGYTGNAAVNGLSWNMRDVLPSPPGLDINGVIYNYTIRKQTEDSVTVNVQNENISGTGYIFRERDEWKPGSLDGTQINKVVPVVPSNRSLWGDGSIEVQGNGSVEDARVLYTYRVDPCYDPQYSPQCPGYKVIIPDIEIVDYEIYDATADAYTQNACVEGDTSSQCVAQKDDDDEGESEEEKEEREAEEEKDRKERLEEALAEADNSAMFANALAQSQILAAIDAARNINSYYAKTISGGVYNETISLPRTELPDNKQGLRNGLAQQLLHQQMVQSQYEK